MTRKNGDLKSSGIDKTVEAAAIVEENVAREKQRSRGATWWWWKYQRFISAIFVSSMTWDRWMGRNNYQSAHVRSQPEMDFRFVEVDHKTTGLSLTSLISRGYCIAGDSEVNSWRKEMKKN